MEDTRPVWSSKWHIFQILQPIRKSGYWRSYCSLQREGDFQTVHTRKTQTFRHQNFQTLWLDWIHIWHESIPGEGQTAHSTAQHVTATHATVTELIEGRGHKLYMDNFFSFPELFDDLVNKQIYCCGTVRPNRRGMPQDLRPKTTKLKRGDIRVRTRADLTAILWRDKRDVCNVD